MANAEQKSMILFMAPGDRLHAAAQAERRAVATGCEESNALVYHGIKIRVPTGLHNAYNIF